MGHHVPAENVLRLGLHLGCQESTEVAGLCADAPDRRQMVLGVELQAVLRYVAVQVDRELSHPEDGFVDAHQPASDPVVLADGDAARQPQVPVEPRIGECAAVHLDAEELPAGPGEVGARLDAQIRTVGVGTDDAEGSGC